MIDRKIHRPVQETVRISNPGFAGSGVAVPTAAARRTQRLIRDGCHPRFERPNRAKLIPGMTVFVEVPLDRTTPNIFEFKAAAADAPGNRRTPLRLAA